MKQFLIRPAIHCYDSFAEFSETVNFNAEDCIFTLRPLYETWLQPINIVSSVLLFENYGQGEPTDEMIDRVLADFSKLNCQRLIAIGGGSVLDIAKILALKPVVNKSVDLFLEAKPLTKDKTLILVPTTCGTGSEVTCISIAALPSKHTKKGLVHETLFADKAALIPELLYGLPKQVLITSSLDALTHAMESFVSPRSHAYSELFSTQAIRLILKSYKTLLSDEFAAITTEITADLLQASNYAGIAFSNTGVGAVHALAYPLGEKYHVFHGEACARFLTTVFQCYQVKNPAGKIQLLTQLLAQELHCGENQDVWQSFTSLINQLLVPKSLRDYGMKTSDIEIFADSVVTEQQRLLINNYVPLSRDEIHTIFKMLW